MRALAACALVMLLPMAAAARRQGRALVIRHPIELLAASIAARNR